MKTVELFSGTKSFSKVMERLGHETYTVDCEEKYGPDLVFNLLDYKCSYDTPRFLRQTIRDADIVWMSPPCQTFSMAAGNTHWTANRQPRTQKARDARKMLQICEDIAQYCIEHGKIFIIENPRARARWFLPAEWRQTVWYCQYGDTRAKPTDFWTNIKGWVGKGCKNYRYTKDRDVIDRHCHHEPSQRGSKTGTQGLKNNQARSVIPPALIEELLHNSAQISKEEH